MLDAIGELLPAAMAVSLSPLPVVAIVLALGSPGGLAAGAAFAIGWAGGLAALTFAALFAVGEADAAVRGIDAWLQIVLGLGLLAAAVRKWRTRPRPGEAAKVPGWLASLDRATAGRALLLGTALGVNPKNIALAFAVGSSIVYRGLDGRDAVIAGLVFVLLGSTTVLGAVVGRRIGGQRAAGFLETVRQFMMQNNNVIIMVVFALIGLKILGDGLAALGS
jgi:threonine/homoserine/homoserine lactone efflux protein